MSNVSALQQVYLYLLTYVRYVSDFNSWRLIMADETRHRERALREPIEQDCIEVLQYPDGSYSADIVEDTFVVSFDNDTMDDVVVNDFRKRIARGEVINNPCYYERTSREGGNGSVTFTRKPAYPSWNNFTETGAVTQFYAWGKDYFSWNDAASTSIQDIDVISDRAKLLALANIDSTPYAFGEDTLELRETMKFLKNPLKGVLDLTRSLERKQRYLSKIRKREKQLLAAKDLFLQYQFAASPLYRSICDAIDAFVSGNRVLPTRLTSRGFASDNDLVSGTHTHVRTGKTDVFDWEIREECEYHAGILYEVSNPVRDWRFTTGLRMKDLPTTFWQVVPLSFMLDRIVDVTSMSKGAINLADPKVKILSAFTRRKYWRNTNLQYVSATRVDRTFSGEGDVLIDDKFIYDRQPWRPSFRDTIPRFTPEVLVDSATKVLELSALIYGPLRNWTNSNIT